LGHNAEVGEAPLSDDEFKRIHRTLQELALAAYPNPERKGCPGREVLRQIANTQWPADHHGYDHVKHCSPCLREVLDLQDEIFMAKTRRRYLTPIGIAAVLALAIGIGTLGWRSIEGRDQHPQAATLNFAASITRGIGSDERNEPGSIQLYPPKVLLLTISLPPGSEDGLYELQVTSSDEKKLLIDAETKARIANGLTTITQKLDFSRLQPGLYIARIRHPPFHQWRRVPIRIE